MNRVALFLRHFRDMYRYYTRWLPSVRQDTDVFEKGYRIVPDMLSVEECSRIRHDFDRALHIELPDDTKTGTYIVARREAGDQYDKHVFHLMNYQSIAPWIVERLAAPIQELFKAEVGHDFRVNSYSIQVDWPDTQTKRGYHNDSFLVNYKAFIYLNDVLDVDADGPYTVIPRSHKDIGRKVFNLMVNFFRSWVPLDNMDFLYPDTKKHAILGKAGTGILSCQALAHKGWHNHTTNKRYVLILYLVPATTPQKEWKLGKEFKLQHTITADDAARKAA